MSLVDVRLKIKIKIWQNKELYSLISFYHFIPIKIKYVYTLEKTSFNSFSWRTDWMDGRVGGEGFLSTCDLKSCKYVFIEVKFTSSILEL